MEFQQVVDRRRMVRNFTDEPVSATQRDRILANALHAPSAGFSQGWAFLVLESVEDRALFWSAAGGDDETPDSWLSGMRRAPLIVVPMSHKDAYLDRYAEADKGWTDRDEQRWPVPYWDIDTGMASLLMLLTVVDEGLGACFFGIVPTQIDEFRHAFGVPPERIPAFRTAFGVPEEFTPVGCVSVGYPGSGDRRSPSLRRGHRPLEEVVHRGRW